MVSASEEICKNCHAILLEHASVAEVTACRFLDIARCRTEIKREVRRQTNLQHGRHKLSMQTEICVTKHLNLGSDKVYSSTFAKLSTLQLLGYILFPPYQWCFAALGVSSMSGSRAPDKGTDERQPGHRASDIYIDYMQLTRYINSLSNQEFEDVQMQVFERGEGAQGSARR
jgi:hypothetical protein